MDMSSCSPSITTMIRMDHTHVMAAFHRYHAQTPWWRKRAIVELACTALEIHAQLEEEIFYPALSEVMAGDERLTKSKPEHDAMREEIAKLRAMGPQDAAYDARFMQLMREVMHHVADEETILLPAAEKLLEDKLGDLGAQMTKRRLQLAGPRSGEIALDMGRAASGNTAAIAMVGLAAAGLLLARRSGHRRWHARA